MAAPTLDSPKRSALRFLGIAIAVSVALAFPLDQVLTYIVIRWRGDPSCGSALALLDLGIVLQAILTPLFVFLLPGAGSILGSKLSRPASVRPSNAGAHSGTVVTMVIALALLIFCPLMLWRAIIALKNYHPDPATLVNVTVIFEMVVEAAAGAFGIVAAIYLLREHVTGRRTVFFIAGWLFAAAVPVAWWYGLKDYATQHGLCEALFKANPPPLLYVDYLYDSYRYYLCLSVFATLWVGIAAAGLRLAAARAAEGGPATSELRLFQNFFWVYWLGWAVQYQFGLFLPGLIIHGGSGTEWFTSSNVAFLDLHCQFTLVPGFYPLILESATADALAEHRRRVRRDFRGLRADYVHIVVASRVGADGPRACVRSQRVGRGLGSGRRHLALARVAEAATCHRHRGREPACGGSARTESVV